MTHKLPPPIEVRLSQETINYLGAIAQKRRTSIPLVIRSILVEVMRDDRALDVALHDEAAE